MNRVLIDHLTPGIGTTKCDDINYLIFGSQLISIQKMSITISTCNEICNSPLNQSRAKMLYTFPKGQRFRSTHKQTCDTFYDLPSAQSSRTTSLGLGSKSDSTRMLPTTPPPNSYNPKGLFQQAKRDKAGSGFGKGRDQMSATGPLAMVRINKNPGPGSYDLGSTLQKGTFSLRPKTHYDENDGRKSPGPGSYPTSFGINRSGSYFLSKYRNSGVASFNPKTSNRFRNKFSDVPGPGTYEPPGDICPEGKYFDSRFKCSLVRSFPHEDRRYLKNGSDTPGPGNYRLPSQFGYYETKAPNKENR